MKVEVKTLSNNDSGQVELPDEIFAVAPREDIMFRVVKWQLAKRRSGNHSVKGRSQVSGTGKKPFRQKGTGNARQGTLRAAQFRTGGVVHGPVKRSHAYSLQKKVRKLGLLSALSYKVKEKKLFVIKVDGERKKTSQLAKDIAHFNTDSLLFIGDPKSDQLKKSMHNIPSADFLPVQGLNVYDILRHDSVAIDESSIAAIKDRLL